MHFKPVFLGVLLATSALSYTAANAAVDPAHAGSPTAPAPVVTNHGHIKSANPAAGTHSAKKLEAKRQADLSRAESRQKTGQAKNSQMHEKVQAKNSAADHQLNKMNSAKEKPQELYPPKK